MEVMYIVNIIWQSGKHVFAERIIKPWNSLPANNDT